jgi:hypothetical protein
MVRYSRPYIAGDDIANEVQWSATVTESIAVDDTAREVQWSATVAEFKFIADHDTSREVQWSASDLSPVD